MGLYVYATYVTDIRNNPLFGGKLHTSNFGRDISHYIVVRFYV